MRGDVIEVFADASGFSSRLRKESFSPLSPVRPLLASCHFARLFAGAAVKNVQPLNRHIHECAIAEADRMSNTAINADRFKWCGRFIDLDFASKRDVPAKGIAGNRCVKQTPFDIARPTKANPSYLWKPDTAMMAAQTFEVGFSSHEPEGIIDALAPWRWVPATGKEVLIRLIKISQSLLLTGLTNCAYEIKLGTKCGQFLGLMKISERLPFAPFKLPIPVPSLFQREIVNKTTHSGELFSIS